VLGPYDWNIDLGTGRLDFEGRVSFETQVLGTESAQSGTWLWAWANPSITNVAITAATSRLRDYGAQYGVPEFSEPQLPVNGINGHTLGLVAAGLCGADAYYLGHHPGGTILTLIQAAELRGPEDVTPVRLSSVFTQFISAFSCHHPLPFSVAMGLMAGCARRRRLPGTTACGPVEGREGARMPRL
jgi:hypothetical protein